MYSGTLTGAFVSADARRPLSGPTPVFQEGHLSTMRTSEIHRRWLDFFAKKDHEIVPSTSLVSSDPSILFTIAGMVPFIPYIVGTEKAPVRARRERPEVHPHQ